MYHRRILSIAALFVGKLHHPPFQGLENDSCVLDGILTFPLSICSTLIVFSYYEGCDTKTTLLFHDGCTQHVPLQNSLIGDDSWYSHHCSII